MDKIWSLVRAAYADMIGWCRGGMWAVRVPLVLWFGYILVNHWLDPQYSSLFGGLDLGIHELGHFVFALFGEFMNIAGGTIFQCLVPIIGAGFFIKQRDYFAISFSVCWLGINMFEIATYAGDAQAKVLPLVAPGGGVVYHDWDYMLTELGILSHDQTVAFLFRLAGSILMIAGIAAGIWILWLMFRLPARSAAE